MDSRGAVVASAGSMKRSGEESCQLQKLQSCQLLWLSSKTLLVPALPNVGDDAPCKRTTAMELEARKGSRLKTMIRRQTVALLVPDL